MPYYDNPAGRLHDLLVRLTEQPGNGTLLNAWATVLDVAAEDIAVHLGKVADLVRETQEAVNNAGEGALLPMVGRFRDSWVQPISRRPTPSTVASIGSCRTRTRSTRSGSCRPTCTRSRPPTDQVPIEAI